MAKQYIDDKGSSFKEVDQKEGDLGLVRRQDKFSDSTEIEGHLGDRWHYAHNTRPSNGLPRPIKK